MKLETMKNAVTSKVVRQVLVGQKHSPQILFGVGVVGVVATTVLACRATLKMEDVLEHAEHQRDLAENLQSRDYSERDRNRDLHVIKVQTAVSIVKLYTPAIACGVISIGALTGSHVVLSRRNAAVMAAYSALERGYRQYRGRVADEFGVEKERELHMGVETREIVEETKQGPKVSQIKTARGLSPYARLFSQQTSNSWEPVAEYNLLFIKAQQDYANHQLQSRGHVFLMDVLDGLGLERTPGCSVVGWVKGNGDDYVDFGIFDASKMDAMHEFMTGREGSIWLDFNVDGPIWDKI